MAAGHPWALEAILIQDESLDISLSCFLYMHRDVVCASYFVSAGGNIGDTEFPAWGNCFLHKMTFVFFFKRLLKFFYQTR